MDNAERIAILKEAMDHQYDLDDNAELVVPSDDLLLKAAQRVLNEFTCEILLGPNEEFFTFLDTVLETTAECASCWREYQSRVCCHGPD